MIRQQDGKKACRSTFNLQPACLFPKLLLVFAGDSCIGRKFQVYVIVVSPQALEKPLLSTPDRSRRWGSLPRFTALRVDECGKTLAEVAQSFGGSVTRRPETLSDIASSHEHLDGDVRKFCRANQRRKHFHIRKHVYRALVVGSAYRPNICRMIEHRLPGFKEFDVPRRHSRDGCVGCGGECPTRLKPPSNGSVGSTWVLSPVAFFGDDHSFFVEVREAWAEILADQNVCVDPDHVTMTFGFTFQLSPPRVGSLSSWALGRAATQSRKESGG